MIYYEVMVFLSAEDNENDRVAHLTWETEVRCCTIKTSDVNNAKGIP